MSVAKLFARRFAALMAFLAMSLGLLVVGAAPASAASGGYGINMSDACHLKYGGLPQHVTAETDNYANPYQWYCQRKVGNERSYTVTGAYRGGEVSATMGNSTVILGGVDTQLYCSTYYPGSKAYVSDEYAPWWNAYNWKCK